MLSVFKEKLTKVKLKLAKIPPEYRHWSTFGILLALLFALPLTVWGLTSSRFEIRERAATGEVTPTPTPSTGFGNAVLFSRANGSYVRTGGRYLANFEQVTIEAWIKLGDSEFPQASSLPIVSKRLDLPKGPGGGTVPWRFEVTGRRTLKFEYMHKVGDYWEDASIETSAAIIEPNRWTHVAVAYDGSTLRLYKNFDMVVSKQQIGPIGGTERSGSSTVFIGYDSTSTESFEGAIDELRIQNGTGWFLSSERGGPYTISGSDRLTVMLFHFDESSGNPVGASYMSSILTSSSRNITYILSTLTPTPTPTPTPTCPSVVCDINGDGKENTQDGNFITGCWRKSSPLGECQKVDVNCDGTISIIDIQRFSYRCPHIFSATTSTPAPQPTPILRPTATPTPTLAPTPTPTPWWWRLRPKLPKFRF